MNERILLVDPDVDFARTLAYVLECQGYQVQVSDSLEAALAIVRERRPPAIVLSEGALADGRGLDLCAAVRAAPTCRSTLFMFLAAQAEEIDRVVAFEMGADDFVAKPLSVRELLLRIRALLRRVSPSSLRTGAISDGRLHVDPRERRATLSGRDARVSPHELAILHLLMSEPERVFHRQEIVVAVWGEAGRVQERTVDSAIKRIRRKLAPEARALETVPGVGFRWRRTAAPPPRLGSLAFTGPDRSH